MRLELTPELFRTPDFIKSARRMKKEADALVNGINYKRELIEKIAHLESKKHIESREKYAGDIKSLFSRLKKPAEKAFTASGGLRKIIYDNAAYVDNIVNAKEGVSLSEWIARNYINIISVDPNSLIVIEINEAGDRAYPCYKSVFDLENYQSDGNTVDWFICKADNYYRVVDGVSDRTVDISGNGITVIDEIFHNLGVCPAVVAGCAKQIGSEIRESFFLHILEDAKEFGRDKSVKTIFKIKHGIPKAWMYWAKCSECKGTGVITTQDGDGYKQHTCPKCEGTTWAKFEDVVDTMLIPQNVSKDDPKIAPDIAGYVSPPIETWVQYNSELEYLEDKMHGTVWGSYLNREKSNTATGEFINAQPVAMVQGTIADWAQSVESKISDIIAKWHGYSGNEPAQIIVYGKRFVNETIDSLNNQYSTSKKDGCLSIMDMMLETVISERFANNPYERARMLRRIAIDPYPHYSLKECLDLGPDEYFVKKTFEYWWKFDQSGVYLPEQANFDAYLEKKQKEHEALIAEKQKQEEEKLAQE